MSKFISKANLSKILSRIYSRVAAKNHTHDYLPVTGGTVKNGAAGTPLNVDTDSTLESGVYFKQKGTNKAWVGYETGKGAELYNSVAQKRISVKDDGTPCFQDDKLWHAGNDGVDSGLDADMLDGIHADGFMRCAFAGSIDFNQMTASGVYRYSDNNTNGPSGGWGQLLVLHGDGDTIAQMAFDYSDSGLIEVRSGNPLKSNGKWGDWKQLARTTDKVASAINADKLGGIAPANLNYCSDQIHFLIGSTGAGITTAQFINKLNSLGAFNYRHWTLKCSWSFANNDTITDTGCGDIQLAGSVIETFNEPANGTKFVRITTSPAVTNGGTPNAVFIYRDNGPTYGPNWKRLANTVDLNNRLRVSDNGLSYSSDDVELGSIVIGSGADASTEMIRINAATTEKAGVMTAEDKEYLEMSKKYVIRICHPDAMGDNPIPTAIEMDKVSYITINGVKTNTAEGKKLLSKIKTYLMSYDVSAVPCLDNIIIEWCDGDSSDMSALESLIFRLNSYYPADEYRFRLLNTGFNNFNTLILYAAETAYPTIRTTVY